MPHKGRRCGLERKERKADRVIAFEYKVLDRSGGEAVRETIRLTHASDWHTQEGHDTRLVRTDLLCGMTPTTLDS
jgi:hypothetical protein